MKPLLLALCLAATFTACEMPLRSAEAVNTVYFRCGKAHIYQWKSRYFLETPRSTKELPIRLFQWKHLGGKMVPYETVRRSREQFVRGDLYYKGQYCEFTDADYNPLPDTEEQK